MDGPVVKGCHLTGQWPEEDLGKHEPPPGPTAFLSLQLQIYASFVLLEMWVLSQPMEDTVQLAEFLWGHRPGRVSPCGHVLLVEGEAHCS